MEKIDIPIRETFSNLSINYSFQEFYFISFIFLFSFIFSFILYSTCLLCFLVVVSDFRYPILDIEDPTPSYYHLILK